MSAFAVGTKVTIKTTIESPSHLACHPHTVIAEVRYEADGPVYWVEHTGEHRPRRFGPFTFDMLTAGW